jgi:alkylation response protein AidB-like acyl-CoA dehydrogenase
VLVRLSRNQHQLRADVHQLLSEPDIIADAEAHRPVGFGENNTYPAHTYQRLGERGWLAINWPVEYGGRGGSLVDAAIIAEELALHGIPDSVRVNTIDNAGATILAAGTAEQKARFLPRIARGELTVSVLYSEPQAGSDLASLQTQAVAGPDGSWQLTGKKVWNAHIPVADYGICAARTSQQDTRYRGISLFMLRLDQPGVHARPIPGFNVEQLYELDLDEAIAEAHEVIGPIGGALPLISQALGLERAGLWLYGRARYWLDQLLAASPPSIDLLREAGSLAGELEAAREVAWAAVFALAGRDDPEPMCAAAKWWTSDVAQRVAWLAWRHRGAHGRTPGSSWTVLDSALLEAPGLTLAAGTSEIMLNTVAAALHTDHDVTETLR